MQRIMDYNQGRLDWATENHPFIQWLKDDSIPVKDRLSSWLPHLSVFAMGFKDLNNILLPYPEAEAAQDERKKIINEHCAQDGTHWEWYLRDLEKLGLNKTFNYDKCLDYLWHDDRKLDRLFMYKVSALVDEAQDPLLRYCVIAPFEFFAHLLFDITAKLAHQLAVEEGIELEYLGDLHSGVEPGNLIDEHHEITDREAFVGAVLPEEMCERGLAISKWMCDQIEARWQGNLSYVQNRLFVAPRIQSSNKNQTNGVNADKKTVLAIF